MYHVGGWRSVRGGQGGRDRLGILVGNSGRKGGAHKVGVLRHGGASPDTSSRTAPSFGDERANCRRGKKMSFATSASISSLYFVEKSDNDTLDTYRIISGSSSVGSSSPRPLYPVHNTDNKQDNTHDTQEQNQQVEQQDTEERTHSAVDQSEREEQAVGQSEDQKELTATSQKTPVAAKEQHTHATKEISAAPTCRRRPRTSPGHRQFISTRIVGNIFSFRWLAVPGKKLENIQES